MPQSASPEQRFKQRLLAFESLTSKKKGKNCTQNIFLLISYVSHTRQQAALIFEKDEYNNDLKIDTNVQLQDTDTTSEHVWTQNTFSL